MQRDIDKQYWQNINRVRVAGSGDANYVVLKDDVGNWYVKSYSVNGSNIYASAASIAQFALGGALKSDIPVDITKSSSERTSSGSNALTMAVSRQFESPTKALDEKATALIRDFESNATNRLAQFTNYWALRAGNTASWTNGVGQFTNAAMTHFIPLLGKIKPRDGKTLLNGLSGLKRLFWTFDASKAMETTNSELADLRSGWRESVTLVLRDYSDKYERLQREHKVALETLSALR